MRSNSTSLVDRHAHPILYFYDAFFADRIFHTET